MKNFYHFSFSIILTIILGLNTASAQLADLGVINMGSPITPMCAAKVPLRVTLFNYAIVAHSFSIDRARITVDVTGASTQNFVLNINSGTIPASSSAQYIVTPQITLTAPGIHHFNVRVDLLTNDVDTANNVLATVDILVNPIPTVTLDTLDDICHNTPAITLAGGFPIGGTYAGTGVSAGMFDPMIAGLGTTTVTYSYVDTNGCQAADSKSIVVNGVPSLSVSTLPPVCLLATSFTLTAGLPAGGTYSGTGVSGGMFDPSVSGVGIFSINYTYVDTNGCSDSSYTSQNVYSEPMVTISSLPSVCANTPAFTLSAGAPSGGTYSGTGVSSTIFDPQISGTGSFSVTYVYIDASGCSDSAMQTQVVNTLPVVSHTSLSDICESAGLTALSGGTPAGGNYSGAGASGPTFNPSLAGPGTFTLIYTYTDGQGCADTAMPSITVIPSPTVTLSSFGFICIDGSSFALSGGSPSGGSYFGTGVSGGVFDPATAMAGSHPISYVYIDPSTTCRDTATKNIVVDPLPAINLNDTIYCGTTLVLGAGNPGSTYLWSTGATTQTIVLTSNDTVDVTVTTSHNCISSDTAIATFFPAPTIDLGEDVDVCQGSSVQLVACSANWTSYNWCVGATVCSITAYSGGSYCIAVRDQNGCIARDTVDVVMNPLPVVTLSISPSMICINAPATALTGGNPTGGIYSGAGVSAGMFDPATAGAGNHTITYTYADTNGCSNMATYTITVGCVGIASEGSPGSLFKLFPNPSNDHINISFEADVTDLILTISDVQGKTVFEEQFNDIYASDTKNINTSSLAEGLYFVRLNIKGYFITQKLIVQH